MALGKKTGGRKKGTPNRKTQVVADKLAALDVDPLEAMVRLARQAEEDGDKALAARMYTELCPYLHPKKRAIEHTNGDPWEGKTGEMLEAEYKALLKQAVKEYEALPAAEKRAYMETEH